MAIPLERSPVHSVVPRVRLSPPSRRLLRWLALGATLLVGMGAVSTLIHLRLPAPTGPATVGRQHLVWTDPNRPEARTAAAGDLRKVGLVVWYPAQAGTGEPASYVPDLDQLAEGLVASGEISSLESSGLRLVASYSHAGAAIADTADTYPVLLLSPGNLTNVEFYGSLAEDLASHGYVVIGINHPYQVAAVALNDDDMALYDHSQDTALGVEDKIDERVADASFVIDRLAADPDAIPGLENKLDLTRLGVLGHSNGGIAAAELCRFDDRVVACANLDGQAYGGPFGIEAPSPTGRPFMYLTKETEIHPEIAATFEEAGAGTFRVVVPAASHGQFTDGGLFQPTLWPMANTADHVVVVARGFVRAFFGITLASEPTSAMGHVEAPTDVTVYVYPLERMVEAEG